MYIAITRPEIAAGRRDPPFPMFVSITFKFLGSAKDLFPTDETIPSARGKKTARAGTKLKYQSKLLPYRATNRRTEASLPGVPAAAALLLGGAGVFLAGGGTVPAPAVASCRGALVAV